MSRFLKVFHGPREECGDGVLNTTVGLVKELKRDEVRIYERKVLTLIFSVDRNVRAKGRRRFSLVGLGLFLFFQSFFFFFTVCMSICSLHSFTPSK